MKFRKLFLNLAIAFMLGSSLFIPYGIFVTMQDFYILPHIVVWTRFTFLAFCSIINAIILVTIILLPKEEKVEA